MRVSKKITIGSIAAALAATSFIVANAAPKDEMISQKKRKYSPSAVTISQGSTLKIINDDIFLHHTFIDSENLEFDSGSQKEGTIIDIVFAEKGTYDVLCAIHPKMKLKVTVE